MKSQKEGLSFLLSELRTKLNLDWVSNTTILWSVWRFAQVDFFHAVKARHIYRTKNHAPELVKITLLSSSKPRGPWRPKRRRGGIDTASRATNLRCGKNWGRCWMHRPSIEPPRFHWIESSAQRGHRHDLTEADAMVLASSRVTRLR